MLLTIVGAVALVFGLLFLAQGSGWFPYPSSSFMIGQQAWMGRGAGLAVLGGALVILARSIRR